MDENKIRTISYSYAAVLIVSLIFALAAFQFFFAPVSYLDNLNLAIAFIGLYIAPGYIIYLLIFPRRDLSLELFPISFCFSLTFVLLPLVLLGYIFSWRVRLLFILYFCMSFILLLGFIIFRAKRDTELARSITSDKPLLQGLLIALILVIAIIGYVIGGFVSGDAFLHIPLIRKYELSTMAFRNAYYLDYYGSQYGVATWHIATALLSAAARVDIINVYANIPFLLIPIYILAFFTFCRTFFRRDDISYTCTFLFIFLFGILSLGTFTGESHPFWEWSFSQVQSFVARSSLLTIALAFSFKYIYCHERRYLLLTFLLLIATATINIYYLLVYEFFMTSMLVTALLFARHDRKFLKENVCLLAAALIPIVFYAIPMVFTFIAPIKNPIIIGTMEIEEYKGIEGIFWGGYPYLNPNRILWADTPRKLGFLLLPFLLFFRKEKWAQFLFGISIFTLLITCNPFLLYYIKKTDVTLTKVARLSEFPVHILIIGFFATWAFKKVRARLQSIAGKLYPLLCLLLIVAFLSAISYPDWRFKFNKSDQWDETKTHSFCSEIEQLRHTGIVDSSKPLVILSDPLTSQLWTFYFPHYVVYVAYSILGPFKIDPTPRWEDMKVMLSPETDAKTTQNLLNYYNVDLVVINKGEPIRSKAIKIFGAEITEIEEKFSSLPAIYRRVYAGKYITVFEYLPRLPSRHFTGDSRGPSASP